MKHEGPKEPPFTKELLIDDAIYSNLTTLPNNELIILILTEFEYQFQNRTRLIFSRFFHIHGNLTFPPVHWLKKSDYSSLSITKCNKLVISNRNVENHTAFKNETLRFINRSPHGIFCVDHFLEFKLLTRLRAPLRCLYENRFSTQINICCCYAEKTTHYYSNQRTVLFDQVRKIKMSILSRNQ